MQDYTTMKISACRLSALDPLQVVHCSLTFVLVLRFFVPSRLHPRACAATMAAVAALAASFVLGAQHYDPYFDRRG